MGWLILFVRSDTLRSLSVRCVERRESWAPCREIWISYGGGGFWLRVVGDTSVTEDLTAFLRQGKENTNENGKPERAYM